MTARRKVKAVVEKAEGQPRYESHPAWCQGARYWEAAETSRINEAHWGLARDESVNTWLENQLPALRARAAYESRQNAMLAGIIATHMDDIVGPHGPMLQVQSDNEAYDKALERAWVEWFSSPTFRPNVSGAALLKLWVRSLWKCGEFLAQIKTDDQAETPIRMRLALVHPRRVATPATGVGDPNTFMGITFDANGRPIRYYVADTSVSPNANFSIAYSPVPADLMIHEFLLEDEEQSRGYPWATPGLSTAADLRDYDDQVQDAARAMADAHGMFWTNHPDAKLWKQPEQTEFSRRTYKMAPPGWQPWSPNTATQPPVQYPDYRGERLRELGRTRGMPLIRIRLDASKHSWATARLELQGYDQAVEGLQYWLSGDEQNVGALGRLVDEVAREGRFAIPELRNRPARVVYQWTWPRLKHVSPQDERRAEDIGLRNGSLLPSDVVPRPLEVHVERLKRDRDLYVKAGLPIPLYLDQPGAGPNPQTAQPDPHPQEAPANA